MVLRCVGWHLIAPATACIAVAGALSGALAMDLGGRHTPPDDIPTGSVPGGGSMGRAKLVWGGPVPKAPIPGAVPVYTPSVPAYSGAAPEHYPQPDLVIAPEPSIEPEPYEPPVRRARPRQAALPPADEGLPPLETPIEVAPEPIAPSVARVDPNDGPNRGIRPPPLPRAPPLPPQRRQSYATLEASVPPRRVPAVADDLPGRGALEAQTPSGYTPMPASEAMCRRQLARLGVGFVDQTSISSGRSCGIDYPVKVSDIAPGIAMRPAATLNCMTALRVATWVKNEVVPDARWKLWRTPTALINASSYRCSRIAGSGSLSEHASGNALDVSGFRFSDGSIVPVEKKGFFEFREKGFQRAVRESACRYFGTVLGPGYNEDHADHLHLDAKVRRRGVCK